MDEETKLLIANWEHFRIVLAPSRALLIKGVKTRDVPHQDLLQLGVFTSRLGYWQVFCCLRSYCVNRDQRPELVLEELPFDKMWTDKRIWSRETWGEVHPFFDYCGSLDSIDPASFVPAAYAIANTIPVSWNSLEIMYSGTELLKECLEHYPVPPDSNTPGLLSCIARKKAATAVATVTLTTAR